MSSPEDPPRDFFVNCLYKALDSFDVPKTKELSNELCPDQYESALLNFRISLKKERKQFIETKKKEIMEFAIQRILELEKFDMTQKDAVMAMAMQTKFNSMVMSS